MDLEGLVAVDKSVGVKGRNAGDVFTAAAIDRDADTVLLEAQDERVGREGGKVGLVLIEELELVLLDTDGDGIEHEVARVVEDWLGLLLETHGLIDVDFERGGHVV